MRRFLNPHHLAHRVLANISNDSSRHDASWQFARSTKSEQRHGAPQFGGFNDHERAKTRVVEMISDWGFLDFREEVVQHASILYC